MVTTTDLQELLTTTQTIAVVGCSPDPARTSHAITRYLIENGFTIYPVNPHHDEILGLTCYPSVDAIPHDAHLDIINIFRRPSATADMVRDTLKRIGQTEERPAIWTQIGVSSREAEMLAEEAGLMYIPNRCIMVEHARSPLPRG